MSIRSDLPRMLVTDTHATHNTPISKTLRDLFSFIAHCVYVYRVLQTPVSCVSPVSLAVLCTGEHTPPHTRRPSWHGAVGHPPDPPLLGPPSTPKDPAGPFKARISPGGYRFVRRTAPLTTHHLGQLSGKESR